MRLRKKPASSFRCSAALLALIMGTTLVDAYSPQPRWGQATSVIYNTLYIHGGKVDSTNTFSYTSAPNTNDLLSLDLSSPFSVATPSWHYLSGSADVSTAQGPAVAFHSLTAYSPTGNLLFGGDGGTPMPVQTRNDSAWLLGLPSTASPQWTSEALGWASQPMRRIYHAAAFSQGCVWISGGLRDDGSNLAFSDTYAFSPSESSFTLIPSNNGPPDLVGASFVVLPTGKLLLIGGYSPSQNKLLPLSSVYILDTTTTPPYWSAASTTGQPPSPRRNFVAVLLDGGKMLVHGGADATLQNTYSDGGILDVNEGVWSPANGISEIVGPRHDHFAVGLGYQALIGFGYASNGPASANLTLYDIRTGLSVPNYTPPTSAPPTNSFTNVPGSTPTSGSSGPSGPSGPNGSGPSSSHPNWPPSNPTGGGPHGGSPGGPPGSDSSTQNKGRLVGIALGLIFGALALVLAVCLARHCLAKHRRRPRGEPEGAGRLIHRDSGLDVESMREGAPVPVTGWPTGSSHSKTPWTMLGLSVPAPKRKRFDMLADEDEREFSSFRAQGHASSSSVAEFSNLGHGNPPEHDGGHGREASGSSVKRAWGSVMGASMATLKHAGSTARRHVSGRVSPQYWEKESPFSDKAALLGTTGATYVLADGIVAPTPSRGSYHDPFVDQNAEGADIGVPQSQSRLHLGEALAEADVSVSSHGTPSSATISGSGSRSAVNTLVSSPRSLPGTSSPPHVLFSALPSSGSGPIKRSDSWWSRFRSTPLRDHDNSPNLHLPFRKSKSPDHLLAFRDPNPPPRLDSIVEGGALSTDVSPVSPAVKKNGRAHIAGDAYHAHGRSASSIQSVHTANSEMLEQMGNRMIVVQRLRTASSSQQLHLHQASGSDPASTSSEYSYSAPPPVTRMRLPSVPASLLEDNDSSEEFGTRPAARPALSIASDLTASPIEAPEMISPFADPPTPSAFSPRTPTKPVLAKYPPPVPSSSSSSPRRSPSPLPMSPRRRATGEVAARIAAYERRMSQADIPPVVPIAPAQTPSPLTAKANLPEGSGGSVPKNVWGVVHKPELFVANPDRQSSGGSP
ncbi:hypothetical protein BOTBODRAFT_27924 [Botryobasidium botryosum FD-172 SS1]|uniref:Galactose oxidase n=1 Tax=Botryobasidium botryosum (strain FD-172 SS1) TaxID=930990 RepID=A0A067N5H0_BOTB1|nr:hypothetical protein BOTBODRAFT_27924 [Botryobasidium botryosum FD-172 SS1]